MRSDQLSKILSTVQIMGFKKQFYHFNLIYIYWFDSAGLMIATGNMNDYADSDSAVACNALHHDSLAASESVCICKLLGREELRLGPSDNSGRGFVWFYTLMISLTRSPSGA